jgi:hypothetical protein
MLIKAERTKVRSAWKTLSDLMFKVVVLRAKIFFYLMVHREGIARCHQWSHGFSNTALPEGLSALTALQTLNLEGCKGLTGLPQGHSALTSLQMLLVLWQRKSIHKLPKTGGNSIHAPKW